MKLTQIHALTAVGLMLLLAAPALGQKVDPVEVASTLAKKRYAGFTHGTGKKQVDCVTYLVAVVEELAKSKRATLSKQTRQQILISHLTPKELSNLQQLVARDDAKIRGVQSALIDAKLGTKVKPAEARAGDLIQYWYKSGGKWWGHAGLIQKVSKAGQATIYGSHKTTLQSERKLPRKQRRGGVGPGPVFNLTDKKRKVFVVRWTP